MVSFIIYDISACENRFEAGTDFTYGNLPQRSWPTLHDSYQFALHFFQHLPLNTVSYICHLQPPDSSRVDPALTPSLTLHPRLAAGPDMQAEGPWAIFSASHKIIIE